MPRLQNKKLQAPPSTGEHTAQWLPTPVGARLLDQPHTMRSGARSAGVLAFILLSSEYLFLRTLKGLQDKADLSALLGARYVSCLG
mmetsp:Transcript_18154/g.36212  ORF Transcript_18154/g.36212 Transcript_18154/m.36212 type:complete len:86 (+) Transcript_18154:530-787(+)